MLPKDLVILGGGSSVTEGIEKGLFEKFPHLFTLGLNYSYRYIQTTVNLGIDELFYNDNKADMDKLPLFIGKEHYDVKLRGDNAYFLRPNRNYRRDCLHGVYSSTLAGLFGLSIFIALMEKGSTIYLLGYDYGPKRDAEGKIAKTDKNIPITHWYQDTWSGLPHRGIGKINWYTATLEDNRISRKMITNAEKEFRPYFDEKDINIVLVGAYSAVPPQIKRISYEEFFSKELTIVHNQDNVREEIAGKLDTLMKDIDRFIRTPITYDTGFRPPMFPKGPLEK